MKKLGILLLAATVIVAVMPAGMALAKAPLKATTEHEFVGHLGEVDAEGWLLIWVGPISGDINGVIKWWMGPKTVTGQAHHYAERVEIWNTDETELLLVGEERGTTTRRHGRNSTWRSNGVVVNAYGEYEEWVGRRIHESGHFTWKVPGLPLEGESTFRVN